MFEATSASGEEQLERVRPHQGFARAARPEVLVIAGTRPECIKLAPIVHELAHRHVLSGIVVNSGQHVEAVRRTFAEFGIKSDVELPALAGAPNLSAASRQLEDRLTGVIARCRPSLVLVQGDTLTAYAGARAGAEAGIRVVHVEAGLRAPSVSDPFPEEWFRRQIAHHAHYHFAPCLSAHMNLLAEGTPPERIHRVGNTGIDSLRALLGEGALVDVAAAPRTQVLVTLHRRENWDGKADIVCDALVALAACKPDLRMLLPVHPNPRIAPRMRHRLGGRPQFTLVAPMGYREFITAAANAALVISDSGGIQEEIPHLGVPIAGAALMHGAPRRCCHRICAAGQRRAGRDTARGSRAARHAAQARAAVRPACAVR